MAGLLALRQTITIRVTGNDPASGNNDLFYDVTDLPTQHQHSNDPQRHPGQRQYGALPALWRLAHHAHGLTDIGFTGHQHNNLGTGAENIGLIYMNARWYVVGIGRFASADTLVPDPQNPQQYNRYTYALNNPLRFTDPTGHCAFAFPFDTLGCIIVGLTLAIDHYANHVEPLHLESNPAPVTGPSNVVAVSGSGIPDITAGLGVGVETQVNTYYHLEDDTFATVACMCSGLMSPDIGASASFSLAWTEAKTAASVAEGFYQSTTVGVGTFGGSVSTAAIPRPESSRQLDFLLNYGAEAANFAPVPTPPGTTGFSLPFGPSLAPLGVSSLSCECSLINQGSFQATGAPWYINALDRIHDNFPQ